MAILICADGSHREIVPGNGVAFTLGELQQFVGGYIEMVRAPGQWHWLVLNEDGKRLCLKPNVAATFMYHLAGGAFDDVVVGDAVLGTRIELGWEEP